MTAIQWISKQAKVIRKKHPSMAWSQCIKKASAEYKAKHKPKTKSAPKKKVGAVKYVEKGETKNTKPKKVYQVNRTKKGTFKGVKRIAGTTHKDTRSHNVNVRVVSGTNRDVLSEISRLTKWNEELERYIVSQNNLLKNESSTLTRLQKSYVKTAMYRYKDLLKSNKKHLTQLKKHIK